ncbi:MAG TPA: TonB-dependent receptor [Steroidobacteraceae bacterium]|nr:TonB-dependent receptor [Steroidobacteraceae bacterium]
MRRPFRVSFLFVFVSAAWASPEAAPELNEVVITGTYRPAPEMDVPASVSVLDAATLRAAGQEHLEDVLALIPNLNWAGDTSRPRYFQIRGIGELEQYQGAPNPSVGLLIDDIDFSGLGSAATLFDVDHIEVLRGPQGMRFGANALGGLIYAQSAEPADTAGGHVELGAGNYGERSYGAVLTGPVPALDSSFRLAAQHYSSDGYYRDVYLNRNDTDRRGELTLRGRWRYQPSDRLRVDLSVLHVQIDNGYDAFTLDNSRNTQSDNPGVDSQHSTGASLRLSLSEIDLAGAAPATLTVIGSYAQTRVKYSFDGDWGNPVLWAPYIYDYNDVQNRNRNTESLEARLGTNAEHGLNWLVGAYGQQLHESLNEDSSGIFFDPSQGGELPPVDSTLTSSRFRSRTVAVFGELEGELTSKWRWTVGLRGERWTARYADVILNPDSTHDFRPNDNLWGGVASLIRTISATGNAYATVSRGYKAGGFNLSEDILPSQIQFNPESDVNFELGYKAELLNRTLRVNTDVFYMRRKSLQVKTSEQLDPGNPDSFTLFTGNADSGFNYGLESDVQWQATQALVFQASLGLLQTRYHGFIQDEALLPDRALPNAPSWQAAVSATYRDPRGPFARVDVTGMGSYYFDLPPNFTTSKPYGLVNGRLGWQAQRWSASVWGRNLLDKKYPVRGFYFSDTPQDFLADPPVNRLYTQLGDPRAWGVNASLSLF